MEPRLFVAAALEGLAVLASQPEHTALAARLLGAASALRAEMGTPCGQPIETRSSRRSQPLARPSAPMPSLRCGLRSKPYRLNRLSAPSPLTLTYIP